MTTAAVPGTCGSFFGFLLHQQRHEIPCPACVTAEAGCRLTPPYAPVTAEQAQHNRRMLGIALREHSRDRKQARQHLAATDTTTEEIAS